MSKANDKQIDGDHYKSSIQHWDYVVANELDYFQAQITKYVTRHKKKHGIKDLEKAKHFLEKYIELEMNKTPDFNTAMENIFQRNILPKIVRVSTEQQNPFGFDIMKDI